MFGKCSNPEEYINFVNQLIQMVEWEGFILCKWSSYDLSVLEILQKERWNNSDSMIIQKDSSIEILGINCLSDLVKIIAPLGWLVHCIIYVKY